MIDVRKALSPKARDLTTAERRLRQSSTVAALLVALGVVVYASVRLSEPVVVRRPAPAHTEDFTVRPEAFDRDVFAAKYDRRLKDLESLAESFESDRRKLLTAVEGLNERLQKEKNDLPRTTFPSPNDSPLDDSNTDRRSDAQKRLAGDLGPSTPPVFQTFDMTSQDAAAGFRNSADRWAQDAFSAPRAIHEPTLSVVTFAAKPETAPAKLPTVADAVYDARPVLSHDDPIAANRAQGASAREYVTAGSIVRGTLLTGVYAPTSGAASGTPVPILIDVAREAILPNGFRADLTDCRLTGNATGELSSERILVRLERLACVGPEGDALDIRVRGYVAGPDGKVGLRGNLVTRSGQAIARALSVGILSGLGKAVALGSSETTTYATGSQSTVYRNSLKAGLGEGASSTLDRIADYYLKVAEQIFPVLEVDGGQPVDLIFSQGVLLETPKSKTRS